MYMTQKDYEDLKDNLYFKKFLKVYEETQELIKSKMK